MFWGYWWYHNTVLMILMLLWYRDIALIMTMPWDGLMKHVYIYIYDLMIHMVLRWWLAIAMRPLCIWDDIMPGYLEMGFVVDMIINYFSDRDLVYIQTKLYWIFDRFFDVSVYLDVMFLYRSISIPFFKWALISLRLASFWEMFWEIV